MSIANFLWNIDMFLNVPDCASYQLKMPCKLKLVESRNYQIDLEYIFFDNQWNGRLGFQFDLNNSNSQNNLRYKIDSSILKNDSNKWFKESICFNIPSNEYDVRL